MLYVFTIACAMATCQVSAYQPNADVTTLTKCEVGLEKAINTPMPMPRQLDPKQELFFNYGCVDYHEEITKENFEAGFKMYVFKKYGPEVERTDI